MMYSKNIIGIICIILLVAISIIALKEYYNPKKKYVVNRSKELQGYWTQRFDVYEYKDGSKKLYSVEGISKENGWYIADCYNFDNWRPTKANIFYTPANKSTKGSIRGSFEVYKILDEFDKIENYYEDYHNDTLILDLGSYKNRLTEIEKDLTDSILVQLIYTRGKPFFLESNFIKENKDRIDFDVH